MLEITLLFLASVSQQQPSANPPFPSLPPLSSAAVTALLLEKKKKINPRVENPNLLAAHGGG